MWAAATLLCTRKLTVFDPEIQFSKGCCLIRRITICLRGNDTVSTAAVSFTSRPAAEQATVLAYFNVENSLQILKCGWAKVRQVLDRAVGCVCHAECSIAGDVDKGWRSFSGAQHHAVVRGISKHRVLPSTARKLECPKTPSVTHTAGDKVPVSLIPAK